MPSERVTEQLKGLPTRPGVYLFRDERGQVLYVGKAKSLRPRVRSYFQARGGDRPPISHLPDPPQPRTAPHPTRHSCASRAEVWLFFFTQSEVEALHLEQNLVKRHRPPF